MNMKIKSGKFLLSAIIEEPKSTPTEIVSKKIGEIITREFK